MGEVPASALRIVSEDLWQAATVASRAFGRTCCV